MDAPFFQAGAVGLLGGAVIFWGIGPNLFAWEVGHIFIHGSIIEFHFAVFPLVVLPFVAWSTSRFRPQNRLQALKIGFSISGSLLLPIPLLSYFLSIYRGPRESPYMQLGVGHLVWALADLTILAAVAASFAALYLFRRR